MAIREQQKLFLTRDARQRLRAEADKRDQQMSDVVEHLINEGAYEATKPDE
ncbi:hypothetical protein BD1_36 [Octadecabacter Antarctic BD virus 1]|nr:hypothetical protein BD1_36 [Octadecabacter Antarctic BD virus 1]